MGSTFTKSIVQQKLSELRYLLEDKSVEEAASQVQQELNLLDTTKLNIAITGVSGAGKSSLVNALRGVRDFDVEAAKIDIAEGTMAPEAYPHPMFPNVVMWDLPGIGTTKFRADEYLKKVNFSLYDFFIIVARDRFTEHDANLAREIRKMGKKFYFVHTQVDKSLESERRKPGSSEEAALKKIRNYCCEHLKKAGESSAKVFLISSWYPEKYDFALLQEALGKGLDDIKKTVFMMAVSAYSKEALERKKDAMDALIWKLSLHSCAVGAYPVPGISFEFNVAVLVDAMKLFCRVFGLDELFLQRLANRVGQPVDELKAAVKKCPLAGEIGDEFVINRMKSSTLCSTNTNIQTVLDYVPLIGSVSGAGLSFITTYSMLSTFLEDAAEDAERVYEKAMELSKKSPK